MLVICGHLPLYVHFLYNCTYKPCLAIPISRIANTGNTTTHSLYLRIPDQIAGIQVISGMVKLSGHYV